MMRVTRWRAAFTSGATAFASAFLVVSAHAANLPDFTDLVADTSASVVNISTRNSPDGQASRPEIPFPKDSPLYEFWEKFFEEREAPSERKSTSLGSGFIISADGYIITNHHVIKDAKEIIVRFNDRRELSAQLVGSDELTDLALLKVKATGLPAVKLGDSNNLLPGQWVIAIGAPFGFEYSVTAGIISGTNRALPWDSHVPFIQTDVATNPGNSGGPLLNMRGEVVGINSQIYSRTGTFSGLAFVIPIEFAMNTIEQIKEKGRVSHGWLGVYVQEVTYELSRSFDMDRPMGALVANVVDDSPAQKAGIQTGDVILEFGGAEVRSSGVLPHMVGMVVADSVREIKLLRNGEQVEISVTLGEIPGEYLRTGDKQRAKEAILGMRLRELSDTEVEKFELDEPALIVEEVLDNGIAQRGGVSKGDVILMIAGTRVKTLSEAQALVENLPTGRFTTLLINRGGRQRFIPLQIPGDDTDGDE